MLLDKAQALNTTGHFIDIQGERFYAINNVDQIAPFFISVISNSDHWMFISSNGALTAGRVSPETALFPYECVDKITDDYLNTGSRTLLLVKTKAGRVKWEPFNQEQNGIYPVTRNLYKNVLGNKVCFEEHNQELGLVFKYFWEMSDEFGFVRRSELTNENDQNITIDILDGIQNILPAGTPRHTQTISSNLVDAYKWTELQSDANLALYTLYSAITDRAEPCESLNATVVYCLSEQPVKVLLSSVQLNPFKKGQPVVQEQTKRGIRGAYFINQTVSLGSEQSQRWSIVANIEQSQGEVSQLRRLLSNKETLQSKITESIAQGSDELSRIIASSDGFQATDEEEVSVHHYANTLFNVMRGGIFADQYTVLTQDFVDNIAHFNKRLCGRHQAFFNSLPESMDLTVLGDKVAAVNDHQLTRLFTEYLPIYFGRRHGDPSRPWNQFSIKLKDEQDHPLLTYQGNWRDIFQNWEALCHSYPTFVESVIAKFVNASTVDGYNPYRITKEGIDWEVEEPEDPWSYIGYWGDHQIIYLLKLLEMSKQYHPTKLHGMLSKNSFCYANVPYRIKDFDALVKDPKDTVMFDQTLADKIEQRVNNMGADGKLVLDAHGEVYQVNLLEKLLVPLLAKLCNLVIDGGIWLNTQRPEWNDANNALVGQGLSMVTLNYLHRYIEFMQRLLTDLAETVELSSEVHHWLDKTQAIFTSISPQLDGQPVSASFRYEVIERLGQVAGDYRARVYMQEGFTAKTKTQLETIRELLNHSHVVIKHTIEVNKDVSGLYHAYNLLSIHDSRAEVKHLYPMLEGQVAALSSAKLSPQEIIDVTNTLFASAVYRQDQQTFMLYPDRPQTRFMQTNVLNSKDVESIPTLLAMVKQHDARLLAKDADGLYRFNSALVNKNALMERLAQLSVQYDSVAMDEERILSLYEQTFEHQSFTGRSGGMFGFEGLGCIYWHMVSKMLLALGENYVWARAQQADDAVLQQLATLYYQVREGIGFNKTPEQYGAFPTDPYSHTPKHNGAQQPGMTGQVKEELLARFIELGICIDNGAIDIQPSLLRKQEFVSHARDFVYLDVHGAWQTLSLSADSLAFTWCQVPFVYEISKAASSLQLLLSDGSTQQDTQLKLDETMASSLFERTGKIKQVVVRVNTDTLYSPTHS